MDTVFSALANGELRKLRNAVRQIEALRLDMVQLSYEQLRNKTSEFRDRLDGGESLDDLLPDAFAVVREVARREMGMEHYPVQLMGGIVLHQGKIAEMQTGEGKTLVATLPAYLNALAGKGVHIVTVNDYLAERDRNLMGRIFEFLGLSVGVVLAGMSQAERKQAYDADITYLTNTELGFDYLRDNMAKTTEDIVQRGLEYAIIDEADSVLIDDARTPLIISSETAFSDKIYASCDFLARRMERGADLPQLTRMDRMAGVQVSETGEYIVMEKEKRIMLTVAGMDRVERFFRIENIADPKNARIMHHMDLALRANVLMERDKDYLVKDGEVLIIDPNTGRIMEGRRYSDGLHQAIETKEEVPIKPEGKTVASITYQSLFNKYKKRSGMTGTARAEAAEFKDAYHMDVVSIPTNEPVIRIDQNDIVYRTRAEKNEAICDQVCESHAAHRPILVGTTSVSVSEELSAMLQERNIPHSVLNAKHHESEAMIVADAGKRDAVTIATNMAGRGTDIKLDDDARAAGGLLVIGTARHESSRIDGQLRGRSGRQGDPGESQFYLSLEDELLRLFGSKRMASAFDAANVPAGVGVSNRLLAKAIEQAQREIEGVHFEQRKRLRKFDEVVDKQREVIYSQRREILESEDLQVIVETFVDLAPYDALELADDEAGAVQTFESVLTPGQMRRLSNAEPWDLEDWLVEDLENAYKALGIFSGEVEEETQNRIRATILETIDFYWVKHVNDLEQLRLGIGLLGYANLDPAVEYQRMASELFERMCSEVRIETVVSLLEDFSAADPDEA